MLAQHEEKPIIVVSEKSANLLPTSCQIQVNSLAKIKTSPSSLEHKMKLLSKIFLGLFSLLFAVIVIGPLGNLVYDQVYKQPLPKLIAIINANLRLEIAALIIIGLLTIGSYIQLKYSDQEPLRKS